MALIPRRFSFGFAFLASVFLAPGFTIELPSIRLYTILPPGGRAGTEVEAGITGENLEEAKALVFSHPGITADAKEKRFIVRIAPEVPPGIYEARVSGLLGISNPRAFVVSDLPQTINPGANQQHTGAVALAIDSTIAGATTTAAADYYRFTAKQNQRLLVACEAREIDSRLRPVLTVLDGAGREIGISRRDGLLDFTAPADADYLIGVHDLTFAGSADFFYRLTLTTGPHIDYVFPPAGAPGTKSSFTLYGRNLPGSTPAGLFGNDGKPLEKLEVEIEIPATAETRTGSFSIPAAGALAGFTYRLKSPRVSNPIFIGFANEPVIAEHESNDLPGPAQMISPPCEVAGQFFPARDVDTFVFDAKKGEVWWIEVISQRLDLPTNPFLLIQRESAEVQEIYAADTDIGGLRFSTASNDPVVRFEVKETGAHRLTLRDLFGGNGDDPSKLYRLVVRKVSPDFQLAALAEPPPENKDDRSAVPCAALLRADGTIAIKVVAFRRDGFAGEIELKAEGLPAGVSFAPARIASGSNENVLLLTTGEKPEPWSGPIRIVGKSMIGDIEREREAHGGAVCWPVADGHNEAIRSRLTGNIALAVRAADPAPVSIVVAEEKSWEVPAGGTIEIPLKVTRRGEFKEALKLKAAGAPGLEPLKEIEVPADAVSAIATLDLSMAKVPTGEHTIHFTAQTKGKFRDKNVTTTLYSAPIRITIRPAPAAD